MRIVLIAAALTLAGCVPTPSPRDDPGNPPDLTRFRMVDLTWEVDDRTLFWPTSTVRFEHEQVAYGQTDRGFFYAAYNFCTAEHGGTHLDAPVHFAEGRWTTDQIPLERLITPAVVIDIADRAESDPDYRLTVVDVERWEEQHGGVPEGSTVFLRTGWGNRWPDAKRYLGDDTPGDASNLHFPSYGEAAVRLLLERGVVALGVDTASIDYGASTDFVVHRIANGENVLGLENVAHLEVLPPIGAWTFALPMKIRDGSGGPLRLIALVPR